MTRRSYLAVFIAMSVLAVAARAQTSVFTYQGRLTDGAAAASGTYQMEFRLFDALTAGGQIGPTVTNNSVTVTNGIFKVDLDFTGGPFDPGASRWIEISVRKAADPPGFTLLSPRQQVTSAPYSIRSSAATLADNSLLLNGLGSSAFALAAHNHDPAYVNVSGDTMAGTLDMGSYTITNIGNAGTDFTATGGLTLADALKLPNGTASLPAIAFTADPNTGIFNSAAGTIDFTIDGNTHATLNFAGVTLTTPTGGFRYSTPRTDHLMVPTAAFSPPTSAGGDGDYRSTGPPGRRYLVAGQPVTRLEAPVYLPQGASIVDLRCKVYDNSATETVSIYLARQEYSTGLDFGITPITSTSGANSSLQELIASASGAIVNNLSEGYWIYYSTSGITCDSNCGISICRIAYTVAKVD